MSHGLMLGHGMRWLWPPSLFAVIALSAPAWAQDPAAAEALFREGRALRAAGKTDEACLKFKASQALEPSSGTLLNLADCHLAQGKTATAWAEFLAAARMARERGKTRQEAEATRRAAELEATLSYLTLRVAEPAPGLELRRNGESIDPTVLGSRVPVDPGQHVLEASAPGHEPVRMTVQIAARSADEIVEIPKLERASEAVPAPAPSPARASQPTAPPAPAPKPRPTAGPSTEARADDSGSSLPWVIGGIGAALLAGGTVAGVLALNTNDDALERCPEPSVCNDAEARSLAERRDTEALLANVGVGVGLAGIGIAAVLLWTQGSSGESAVVPSLSPRHAGLNLVERF